MKELNDLKGSPFRSNYAKNVVCDAHVNLETEFVIVINGELTMVIENVEYVIKANEGIFVQPFETHSFQSKRSESYILLFNRDIAHTFYSFIQNKSPLTRIFPVPNPLIEWIRFLCPEIQHHFQQIKAESVLAPLIAQIVEYCFFKEEKTIKSDLVATALAVINEQFLFPLSLEQVSKQIGCHPVTLSKTFHASLGIGFSAYISLRRCYYAKTLLDNTKNSITQIALDAGFGSLRDFNRCFKKIFSLTATEYRKANVVI